MARAVDVQAFSSPAQGWNMISNTRTTRTASLANGTVPTALPGGGAMPGSPGAVLGTGMNADTYLPGIEAV